MKIITKNKRAFFDYEILEKFEAGIVLTGPEVKSVKAGHISLKGSYVTVHEGELLLLNCHISPYKFAQNQLKDYNPTASRKLLVHKKEINYLIGKLKTKGLTLLPLSVYLKRNKIKLEIGLGRGKKKFEKREKIKKREAEREIKRALKNH